MAIEVNYKDLDPKDADEMALEDLKAHIGESDYSSLVEMVHMRRENMDHGIIDSINITLGFWHGVTGMPFYAFCRKYALKEYREWMHSDPNPVMTDENGHNI